MKKAIKFLTLLIFAFALVGCVKPEIYTVTFDTNTDAKIEAVNVKKGDKLELPEEPTKEGYVFEGWYIGDDKFDENETLTEDITLTANWALKELEEEVKIPENKKTYNVKFVFYPGIKDAVRKVEEKKAVSKPANPTRTGYTFDGWYLGTKKYDFKTKVTKNITLTAKWNEVETTTTTTTTKNNKPTTTTKPVDVTSIKLSDTEITLNKGDTYQIKTTFTPSNASNKNLTYKTSNSNIATVDSKGVVTAKANSKSIATITVTSSNGKTATLKVNAISSVTGGRLDIQTAVHTNHAITQHGSGQDRITYRLALFGSDYQSITWVATGNGGYELVGCKGTTCTIKATNDGITSKRTVTLVARVEKYDGEILEITRNIVIEGTFAITHHPNGNNPITSINVPLGETKKITALASRVGYFNFISSNIYVKSIRISSTVYDIECTNEATAGPHLFTGKSDAGQVYTINVTCLLP